jgi:hypothetical protein
MQRATTNAAKEKSVSIIINARDRVSKGVIREEKGGSLGSAKRVSIVAGHTNVQG